MVAGGTTIAGSADADPKERYVHHAAGRSGMGSYLDSVILRDRDQNGGGGNNGAADGTLEQRVYFGQNWRADTVVLMSSTGRILERVTYSAYGVATRHPVADFNRDGFTDFFDDADYDDCYTGAGCPSGQTADMNLDGFVDSFDYDEWDLSFSEQGSTARGVLSQSNATAAVNRIGYAGYFFEPATQTYLVRNREYDPNTGVWDERDPLEYHDGSDLYMYVKNSPITGRDPMGLRWEPNDGNPSIPDLLQPQRNPLLQPQLTPQQIVDDLVQHYRCCRECGAALSGSYGIAVCCHGRPVFCINGSRIESEFSTPTSRDRVLECVRRHERIHVRDLDCSRAGCPAVACPASGPNVPGTQGPIDKCWRRQDGIQDYQLGACSECHAYSDTIACIAGSLADPSNPADICSMCRFLEHVISQRAANCPLCPDGGVRFPLPPGLDTIRKMCKGFCNDPDVQ
jgi:RHS repeat-associated protein